MCCNSELQWLSERACIGYVTRSNTYTVDREMFAVKIFSPLAQVAKILRAKICLRRIIRVTLPAVAKMKHAEIYHAKKNAKFSRSTVVLLNYYSTVKIIQYLSISSNQNSLCCPKH